MKFSHTIMRDRRETACVYHVYNLVLLQIISRSTQSTTESIRRIEVYKINQDLLNFSITLFFGKRNNNTTNTIQQNAHVLSIKI